MAFCQAPVANPNSSIFFSRSKGLTEEALAELGYKDTIMFRPMALSNTNRPVSRGFVENAFLYAYANTSSAPSFLACRLSVRGLPSLTLLLFLGFLIIQIGHWRTRSVQRQIAN
jgi:hypothetical protein